MLKDHIFSVVHRRKLHFLELIDVALAPYKKFCSGSIYQINFFRYLINKHFFVRYATKLNLNVAIPAWNHTSFDPNIQKDNPLNVKHIKSIGDNDVPTDILANHMLKWNYTGATNLIGTRLKTFTILRDPVTQFESLYSYMELEKMHGMSLKELITILIQNNSTAIKELNNKPRQGGLFGHNQIAWDLS